MSFDEEEGLGQYDFSAHRVTGTVLGVLHQRSPFLSITTPGEGIGNLLPVHLRLLQVGTERAILGFSAHQPLKTH